MSAEVSRRALIAGSAALAFFSAAGVQAKGRTTAGGRLSMRVPWPVTSFDPHRLEDGAAAIFGEALFDTLYAREESGAFVPSLAEADPEPEGATLRVRIRAGVRTAKGRAFEPRDAAAAITRARTLGASAWLSDVPPPKADARSLVFAMRDAGRLVRALAAPVVAMTPPGFSPESPDGTGPMRLSMRGDAAVFSRNPFAARGPSFLDEMVVRAAPTVEDSLRSFEAGTDDLGWLGQGLHDRRAGSQAFDFGAVAFAVLYTGRDALDWDAPGVAQRLCDGIPPSRLSHLAPGPAWTPDSAQGWGGPTATLFVRDDAPWLVELARAVAAMLSRPGHEVTAKTLPAQEITQRRASRSHALLLDVVRPVTPDGFGAMIALATADNAGRASELVQRPPKIGNVSARTMTRTLRAGVVGEVRVMGGRTADVQLAPSANGAGVNWGSAARVRLR